MTDNANNVNAPAAPEVAKPADAPAVDDKKPVVAANPAATAAENEAAAVAAVAAAAVPASPSLNPNAAMPAPGSMPSTPGASGSAQHTSASLYVGDLHPEVTENTLYEIFQAVGPVQSIRVCRDVVTRRSLGYAYINFHNVQDAARALDTMNYYTSPLTKDKPLRIMWKIRDPSVRKTGAGNIFVKSLAKDIDNKALYDTFQQFGPILSCKVAMNDHGESLGYGFVHFQTPEAAAEATAQVNGMLLNGRKVYVGKFLNKREREAAGQINKSFTNVYVKNLDEQYCDEEKLRDIFSEYGDITSIYVPVGEDGKGKGFAFVNFSNPEMAARAVEEMDGKDYEGKTIFVGRAQKRSERETELRNKYEQIRHERMQKYQGVNLYIKNLSDDVDDDKLREEFSKFGTITSCKVMRDDKGLSRGFGFVCFTQPEEATKAVTELNGRMLGLKPIYVALAQRKDVRRAQLEAQRAATMRMPGATLPPGAMYAQPSPYMYQNTPVMQMGAPGAMHTAGRGYMNPTHIAMGRGGPGGRGVPMTTPYMNPMGRGQPPMAHAMTPAMMQPYGMPGQRQPRQNRARQMGPGPQGQGTVQPMRAGGRGRGGVPNQGGPYNKYPQQARQQPMPQQQQGRPAAQQQQAGQAVQGANGAPPYSEPLTLEMLTSATPQQQKQMLGEKLYPQIAEKQPTLAGKITGMLLEMDNPDILHLLESPEALSEQVDEALKVLRSHAASAGSDAQQAQQVV